MRHAGGKSRRHLPKHMLPVLGAASTHCWIAPLFSKVAAVVDAGAGVGAGVTAYAGSKSKSRIKSKHQSECKDEG